MIKLNFSVFMDHIDSAVTQSGLSYDEVFKIVCEIGITSVDIDWKQIINNQDLIDLLAKSGLKVNSIYVFCDFADNQDISVLKKAIDFALKLKCIVMPIPGNLDSSTSEKLKNCKSKSDIYEFMSSCEGTLNMKNALTAALEYATFKNVILTIEDFDSNLSPTSRIHELTWFMENVPGLKMNFDTGNFVYNDESLIEAYNELKPYIFNVHCKDRDVESGKFNGSFLKGLSSCAFGSGYLPVKDVVTDLVNSGYDGGFSIEHFGLNNQLEAIKKSADFLKSFIN